VRRLREGAARLKLETEIPAAQIANIPNGGAHFPQSPLPSGLSRCADQTVNSLICEKVAERIFGFSAAFRAGAQNSALPTIRESPDLRLIMLLAGCVRQK